MKTIKLPCFNITITINNGAGKITSDLYSYSSSKPYRKAIDVMESLILAHACAGIDVGSNAYIQGIEVVFDKIANLD